jgi:PAS domain S-box-containing protein
VGIQWLTVYSLPVILMLVFTSFCILSLAADTPLSQTALSAIQTNKAKRVLILMEEDVSWPAYRLIDENVRATLRSGSPGGILIFSEHLDRVHFPDSAIQAEQLAWIKKKYANSKLDLVIAVGEVPPGLFPGVPLVFLSDDPRRKPPNPVTSATSSASVWVDISAQKTLELAQRLQPGARRIVVIGDGSPSEDTYLTRLRRMHPTSAGDMPITYLTNPAVPEICQRVSELRSDSIVIFTGLSRDEHGQPLISAEVIPIIAAASRAPVYSLVDTHIGTGAVGGYVASFAEVGKAGGQLGLRIIAGEHPQDVVAENVYLFDWRQLRRWNIPESVLPTGSLLLNRQPTVWESHRKLILGGIALIALQALLIFGLLWQRANKRKVERSLVERLAFEHLISDLSTTLLNLPEEKVEAMIEKSLGGIAKFLRMDRIAVQEFSPDEKELVAALSWRAEEVPPVPTDVKANKFPWWTPLLLRGETVLVSDLNALPEDASAEREYLQKLDTISCATLPLKAGDDLFGCISFVMTKGKVLWSEELVNQLKIFAEIFSNTLKRKRTTQALVASNTELKRAEAVLRESEERFHLVADTAPVLVWMSGTDKLCTFFNKGWLDFTGRSMEQELGEGWASGVHPDDLEHCLGIYSAAFNARVDFEMEYRLRRFDGKYRWLVDCGVPRFESDRTFCGYIGICIDITERKLTEESLEKLSGRLITAQEEERTRIARELHDDFSQRLALQGIGLGQLWKKLPESDIEGRAKVQELVKTIQEMSSDMHSLSHQLHSSKLQHVGLGPAVMGLCEEISKKYEIQVEFTERGVSSEIPKDVALCLFRVAQEALGNMVKHSRAKQAQAELLGANNEIRLRIVDAGVGFDPALRSLDVGIGLVGMRERLRLVGGTLWVSSVPKQGTEIIARVPLSVSANQAQVRTQVAGE